jgi:Homeodomain-like domain
MPMIAAMLHSSTVTIVQTCKRFLCSGLDAALYDRPRPAVRHTLDGRQKAHLVMLACSAPPADRERWSLRLLADPVVESSLVEYVSYTIVWQIPKKALKP